MKWIKRALHRYDQWCKNMGLVEASRPRCVMHKSDAPERTHTFSHGRELDSQHKVKPHDAV